MASETIAVASDHAGFALKQAVVELLRDEGFDVQDLGAHDQESVDYPDFADALAGAIADGPASRGVLVCGTGIGISIAANRHRHIRAALCQNSTDARLSRQHNDANVIALGARTLGPEVAADCVRIFLQTEFEGGRHQRRVSKMS